MNNSVALPLPCSSSRAFFSTRIGKQTKIDYASVVMHDDRSDEELMQAYAGGDAGSFDILYQRHRDKVYRYFYRHCPDSIAADDLFQDTWSNIIRARARYTASSRFAAWMFQIAHNRLMDYFRRQRVRAVDSLDDDPADTTSRTAEQQLDNQRAVDRLYALLYDLPQEQRDAFLLKEEAGLSLDDIAMVTGTNRETVKSRLRYALNRLKQGLGYTDE